MADEDSRLLLPTDGDGSTALGHVDTKNLGDGLDQSIVRCLGQGFLRWRGHQLFGDFRTGGSRQRHDSRNTKHHTAEYGELIPGLFVIGQSVLEEIGFAVKICYLLRYAQVHGVELSDIRGNCRRRGRPAGQACEDRIPLDCNIVVSTILLARALGSLGEIPASTGLLKECH